MLSGTMVFYWPGARRQWPVVTFGSASLKRAQGPSLTISASSIAWAGIFPWVSPGEDLCELRASITLRKGSFQRVLHDKEELLVISLRIPLSIINKNCDQLSARNTRRHTDAEYIT